MKPLESLTLRGGVWYSHNPERVSDQVGTYLLATYRPCRWWEGHAMIDYSQCLSKSWQETQFIPTDGGMTVKMVEMESSDARYTALTLGTRVFAGKQDRWSGTFDVKFPLEQEKKNPRFEARVQMNF